MIDAGIGVRSRDRSGHGVQFGVQTESNSNELSASSNTGERRVASR